MCIRDSPSDVLAAQQRNQMQYFYGDVLLRGTIPGYAWRYFHDQGFHLEVKEEELESLKNTADFFSFSYYYKMCIRDRCVLPPVVT